jgi:hypothetical protein
MADTLAQEGKRHESAKMKGKTHHKVCGGSGATAQALVEIRERRFASGQEDRRKEGVKGEKRGRNPKNNLKILLTENGESNDTPVAPASALP